MAEIARLEAVLTADIKPLVTSLQQAQVAVEKFGSTGAQGLNILNAGLSKTALAAVNAATDIRSMTAALDVLQAEQSGIIRGTTLWNLYEKEIRRVNAQLTILETQLPIVAVEERAVASGAVVAAGGLTAMWASLRQIAFILPGIGIAGIFNLAFTAIASAASALDIFGDSAKEAATDIKDFEANAAGSIANVKALSLVLLDNTNSLHDRKAALAELTKADKEHFAALSVEKSSYEDIKAAVDAYTDSLVREAVVKGMTDDITELSKALRTAEKDFVKAATASDIANRRLKAFQTSGQGLVPFGVDIAAISDANKMEAARLRIVELRKEENDLQDALNKKIAEQIHLTQTPAADPGKQLKESFDKIKPEKFIEPFIGWIPIIKGVNEEFDKTPDLINKLAKPIQLTDEQIKALEAHIKGFVDVTQNLAKDISKSLITGFAGIGEAIGGGGDIFASFRDLLGDGLKAIGEDLIKIGTLALVAKLALESLFESPVAAIAAGIALVALGSAISTQHRGIHGHAEGGIFTQATLLGSNLVGENGPEALIPLSKLGDMLGNMGGTQRIEVIGRISGNDIVLINNRQNLRNSRSYGSNFNSGING